MGNVTSSNANPSGGTSRKVEGAILNLTQHVATPDQLADGVYEPEEKEAIQKLLTFEELPGPFEIIGRATALAKLAVKNGAKTAMIGGAPFLTSVLQESLRAKGIRPVYAFSRRESVEQTMPDGSTRKVAVFRHLGFVEDPNASLFGWDSIEA